jgi:hypothetical protein
MVPGRAVGIANDFRGILGKIDSPQLFGQIRAAAMKDVAGEDTMLPAGTMAGTPGSLTSPRR